VIHGRAVAATLDLFDLVDPARVIEDPLAQGRLARVDVGGNAEIANSREVHTAPEKRRTSVRLVPYRTLRNAGYCRWVDTSRSQPGRLGLMSRRARAAILGRPLAQPGRGKAAGRGQRWEGGRDSIHIPQLAASLTAIPLDRTNGPDPNLSRKVFAGKVK
jgi:hypothetical protein